MLACGLSDQDIRRWVKDGRWQRVLPGIYAAFTGELTLEQRRFAAFLFAGPNAQLTGVAALRWHGLTYLPHDNRVHMLVPHTEHKASYGFVRVQRAKELDPTARSVNGYVVCSVARAVADACRGLDDLRSVRAIIAEAVQRGMTSVVALSQELDRAGRHRTRLLRHALVEIDRGAASAPEADVQAAFNKSKILPAVLWNPNLETAAGERLPSPDGWIKDAAIAIEVDSRQYHLSPEGWERTLRRHNALTETGALVLHFTPSDARRPRRVVRIAERAYLERMRSGVVTSIRVVSDHETHGGVLQ